MPRTRRRGSNGRGAAKKTSTSKRTPIENLDIGLTLSDGEVVPCPTPVAQKRGRAGSRGRRNASSRVTTPVDSPNIVLSDDDDDDFNCSLPILQASRRNSTSRRKTNAPRSGKSTPRGGNSTSRGRNSTSSREKSTSGTRNSSSKQKKSTTTRSRGSRQPRSNDRPRSARPVVVSLDVTYSSDELEAALSSPEKPDNLFTLDITPSPEPQDLDDSFATESNTQDTGVKEKKPQVAPPSREPIHYDSDEEEEDLCFVDYGLTRERALKDAVKELARESKAKEKLKPEHKGDDDSFPLTVSESTPIQSSNNSPKRVLDDVDLDLELEGCASELSFSKRVKKTKQMKQAQKQLKQFTKEIEKAKANLSADDVTVMSDEEDDLDDNLTLFIQWNSNYVRWPVRQFQKFSSIYKDVAERFNLNVAQMLLCHDDKIISHDVCPKDINLKFGDFIECGVQSQPTVPVEKSKTKHSADSIPLKVQTSDRRETVTIHIDKNAKMRELMHRYAEEKSLQLSQLKFRFDGESLDPNDTPQTLDLEGNECIDVFIST